MAIKYMAKYRPKGIDQMYCVCAVVGAVVGVVVIVDDDE